MWKLSHAKFPADLTVTRSSSRKHCPVYTSEWVRKIILRSGTDPESFDVASNPEFLREGTAVTIPVP